MAVSQNPKIVVSYRRSESAMAGRIFDRLAQHFGKNSLFIDIDNVPFGVDFRKHIDEALQSSDLLIAVVGQNWLGAQPDGKRRINNAADPVRVELETALRRDLAILPVLLDGSSMPDAADLPESIQDFAYRNALEVESGRDFNVHIDRLIRAIEQSLGVKAKVSPGEAASLLGPALPVKKSWPKLLALAVAGVLLAAGLGYGAWVWLGSAPSKTAEGSPPAGFPAFCDDLKRVVGEARTQFTSMLGIEQGGGFWTARVQLPGWNDCTVRDWTYEGKTTRYFSCELPPLTSIDDVHAMRDKMATYVKPCLGPDWTERRAQFSDQTTDFNYEMGQNDPVVRLRESHYKDVQQWVLKLQVDAPRLAASP